MLPLQGGYASASRFVNLYSGGTSEADMALQRFADNESACFLEALFAGAGGKRTLALLRAYRDRVLLQTERGKAVAESYYRHSAEVSRVLQRHPGLADRIRACVVDMLPGLVRATAAGRPLSITGRQREAVRSCLETLRGLADCRNTES